MIVLTNLAPINQMLSKRGLQKDGISRKRFSVECARQMDSYVPMMHGPLKNTRIIDTDSVTYNSPYAKYQYYGKLMVSPSGSAWARFGEPKHLTDKNLTYTGAPKRGKLWNKRMWSEKKHSLLGTMAIIVGGKAK